LRFPVPAQFVEYPVEPAFGLPPFGKLAARQAEYPILDFWILP
jgi:hypothetical protein